jgi:poly-gamma-glutamate synthesis protein (capsule biosynthesis protein)
MAQDSIVLLGVGDMGPVHDPMDGYGALSKQALATGDIVFGQCERLYSDRIYGDPEDLVTGNRPLKPEKVSIFTDCGFNVVSMGGNHTMDWGPEAMLDTLEVFKKVGIPTMGAGRNLKESRRPVFFEKNGVKVAILAYCTILRPGQEAGPDKPGVAPLRAHTSYEPYEFQAGVPPRIITVPYEEDLANMVEDIKNAKKAAHVVVLSLHWGVHYIPRLIAEYQPIAAKAAFDAGADLILGHHPHAPKAIGCHDGKVCFYSLGNFIFTTDAGKKPNYAGSGKHYGVKWDIEEYPRCPHGPDSKITLIAKAVLGRDGVRKVSFLPARIDKQLRPEVLRHGDPRFDEVVNFLDWASEDFNHKFTVEGDEVVVTG